MKSVQYKIRVDSEDIVVCSGAQYLPRRFFKRHIVELRDIEREKFANKLIERDVLFNDRAPYAAMSYFWFDGRLLKTNAANLRSHAMISMYHRGKDGKPDTANFKEDYNKPEEDFNDGAPVKEIK